MENKSGAYPSYLALLESGELAVRRDRALAMLESCSLCPRACGVNRLEDEKGVCRIARRAVVSSAHSHFGEETPLVGTACSGTIFFSGCNLKCLFCQNYEISHLLAGDEAPAKRLAFLMLRVQEMGCHNLNLVTPTHVVPQILEALELAVAGGFRLPLVYNTGDYDSIEVIREVLREMHRQVGDLEISSDGIAVRGLLVRHLVMPGMLEDTERIVAFEYPPLDRALSRDDWREALRLARTAGLHRFDEC